MNENGEPNQQQPERGIGSRNIGKYSTPAQPATEQQLRATELQIEERMTGFERSMVRLTRYGLAVTVLTGIIFAGQLYEMINGGTQTDKLVNYAKGQADAATDQADAAQQFSDTAEDINSRMEDAVDQLKAAADSAKSSIQATQFAMRLEQRAWVGLTVVDVPKPLPTGTTFELVNHFLNTGKTPAIRIHAVSEFVIDVPNTPPIYKESDAPEGPPLLPGAEIRGTGTVPILSEETAKSIKNGTVILYDRGAVWYWDVFGRKHIATFCLAYNVSSGAFHADRKLSCKKQEAN
jgi:hypothetical protein